jgi:hypothetical protein
MEKPAMRSPFVIYFAGVGTVVAALAVGFGGGLALTKTSVVKETPAASAARLERIRATKPDEAKIESQAGGNAVATSANTGPTLLTVATQMPVDIKPAATAPQTPAPPEPAVKPVSGVQGVALYEGVQNAIPIQQPKRAIAAASDSRKFETRRQPAQRRTREVIVQSQRDDEEADAMSSRSYRVVQDDRRGTIVRTYEARSGGFGRFFSNDDED